MRHAQIDVKECPLTSLRVSLRGLQLPESNNNTAPLTPRNIPVIWTFVVEAHIRLPNT